MDFFTWCMIVAGFGMSVAAVGCGISQSLGIMRSVEGIGRNPGAGGKIMTTMMIGLAMIESLAIYVFVVAMIILFANPFTDIVVKLTSAAAGVK